MSAAKRFRQRAPLERVLFGLAGSVVLIGALLSTVVSQWLYVIAGDRPPSLILRRMAGLEGCSR